jgi:hypothetical protein
VKQAPGTLAASLDPGLRSRVEWLTTEALGASGGWTKLPLQNGWANMAGELGFVRSGPVAYVFGTVRPGTIGTAAGQLPASLKPAEYRIFPAVAQVNTTNEIKAGRVDVDEKGNILVGIYMTGTYDWISFGFPVRLA